MSLLEYLGNWTWPIVVGGLVGLMIWLVPLFSTKEERKQDAEAQKDAAARALARAVQLRSRDDVRILFRDVSGRGQVAGQADGRHAQADRRRHVAQGGTP